jgi:hypothetical protein
MDSFMADVKIVFITVKIVIVIHINNVSNKHKT